MSKLSKDLIILGNELGSELKELYDRCGMSCGELLLTNFAKSLDLPDDTRIEVEIDQKVKKIVHVSRIRKILAGCPPLVLAEGVISKREAAIALIYMKIYDD